ncbi:hypothetical protein GMW39_23830 [Pectobacterium parmentieri]|uniref:hypothetical protein n=1 Tax=Pectobacterium parmentieri TaxID=1905730 RepID=UPI0013742B69|nr:hypothetical protein [Pectobacterium parmentieri]QHQ18560.1 hypothetical protein GMW39_23830 [Pectobacterium parmentieri]QQA76814.1 hypothetical protein JBL47_04115 [Pectobacterium parmentieri]
MKLEELNAGISHHGQDETGFVFHNFLVAFDSTFNQSNHIKIKNFFEKNKHIKKWMIFSDYVLYDKKKPNDVVTFSIFPYAENFFKLGKKIDALSFKDTKKLKRINKEFINFIKKSEILNLSILLSKDRKLDPFNEREMLKTRYEMAIRQVNTWIKNQGEKVYFKQLTKNLQLVLKELDKSGANLKAIRDIEIVSSLTAYIAFQISQEIKIDTIGWFSDRDAMLSYKIAKFSKPIIYDLAFNAYHVLMYNVNEKYKEKFVFGLPEAEGRVWYDSYNRVPDLIAATLADYNYEDNICSHDKYIPVIDEILADSEKNIIYKISFNDSDNPFSAGVISLGLKKDQLK